MKTYTDAQVLEGFKTLPVATYFDTFGQSFDNYYGEQKNPSKFQQSYNALASAWVAQAKPENLTEEILEKLISKIQDNTRTTGGVHIRNVQTGNLLFASENLVLINIPTNIRVVPEKSWTKLIAVMLAKKLSEILRQMREGNIDYSMAKTEVESLKKG